MKLRKIGLSKDQVASGILLRMTSILDEEFVQTSMWATQNKHLKPSYEWFRVYVNDPSDKSQSDSYMVIYVNELAFSKLKKVFETAVIFEEIDEHNLPDNVGVLLSIPFWQ